MIEWKIVDPDPNISHEQIIWENFITADKNHKLDMICCLSTEWIKTHNDKNLQDLEREFRRKKMDTYIISENKGKERRDHCELSLFRENDNITYEHEVVFSCRPPNYAMEELLQHWSSYDENFMALAQTGFIVVKDEKCCVNNRNECFREISKEQLSNLDLIARGIKKLEVVRQTVDEVVENINNKCEQKFGKKAEMKIIGMNYNGGPIMAFFIDNKIITNVGVSVAYDCNGNMRHDLININELIRK